MRRGSLRELRQRPTTNFTVFALVASLVPASVAGVLKQQGIEDPWSGMRFAVASAYRTFDSAYEEDLAPRLRDASQQSIIEAIKTAPDDAMLPGGIVYLADGGLRLERVDPQEAATMRAENRRFDARTREHCGASAREAISACDPITLYDLIRAEFDAIARQRITHNGINYDTLTGEWRDKTTGDAPRRTRDLLLLESEGSLMPAYEQRSRGARARIAALVNVFTDVQPHEQHYSDEMLAYAKRPNDATLYGTWEYRPQHIDWGGAREAGKRKPHLVVLSDKDQGTLVWQFYRGTERGFLIAPDGSVGEYTP